MQYCSFHFYFSVNCITSATKICFSILKLKTDSLCTIFSNQGDAALNWEMLKWALTIEIISYLCCHPNHNTQWRFYPNSCNPKKIDNRVNLPKLLNK